MESRTQGQANDVSGPGNLYLRPELHDLKIIGVEEHVTFPAILSQIPFSDQAQYSKTIFGDLSSYPAFDYAKRRVTVVDDQRIKDMNDGQIAMQILSLAGPVNSTLAEPALGLKLAEQINDKLKEAVDRYPSRFAALGELPFQAPALALHELHRCVKDLGFVGIMLCGSVGGNGEFLDDPKFDDLLTAFEDLDVPLYLHPGIAPKAVIDSYYTFSGKPLLTAQMAGSGWGWHNEVAIHVIRMAVSGTLDRHPRLKLVVGHQGEMMPMMLQRFDSMFDPKIFGLQRSIGEILRSQVWIAISGLFSIPPTMAAIQTWGVDHVLFANDYPFIPSQNVSNYVRALGDLVAPSDLRKICQTNAEALFKMTV